MAETFSATTKVANRMGMNLVIYELGEDDAKGNEVLTIDFANEVSIEGSDYNWATGGQNHENFIGFVGDPGTLTISTQEMTQKLMQISMGEAEGTGSVYKQYVVPQFYYIEGTTAWVGEDKVAHSTVATFYKAAIVPSLTRTYTGTGDPQTIEITFNLYPNKDQKIYSEKFDTVQG